METVCFSELRKKLKEHMDQVCAGRTALLVTRQGGESVVMLSLKEYESLEETLHLLGGPENAEHLKRSMAQAEAGEFVEFDDIDRGAPYTRRIPGPSGNFVNCPRIL